MPDVSINQRSMVMGAVIGAVAVGLIFYVVARALDVSSNISLFGALAIGLFVGGPLGFMVGGRLGADTDDRGARPGA